MFFRNLRISKIFCETNSIFLITNSLGTRQVKTTKLTKRQLAKAINTYIVVDRIPELEVRAILAKPSKKPTRRQSTQGPRISTTKIRRRSFQGPSEIEFVDVSSVFSRDARLVNVALENNSNEERPETSSAPVLDRSLFVNPRVVSHESSNAADISSVDFPCQNAPNSMGGNTTDVNNSGTFSTAIRQRSPFVPIHNSPVVSPERDDIYYSPNSSKSDEFFDAGNCLVVYLNFHRICNANINVSLCYSSRRRTR